MEIFISAGEASGDLHGANLAASIRAIAPETKMSCLGGPGLKGAGVPVIVDNRKISVIGISEVFSQIRSIYAAWVAIKSHLQASRPSVVVLIDFPDFNLLLGRFAKKMGSRVFFYISPQVWAWREGRVKTIGRLMDGMAVILPFEKAFYAARGIAVDYVGHPLTDSMKDLPEKVACDRVYHDFGAPLVGLLPGSRRGEIERFFDLLMDAGRIILESFPEARFIMPVASSIDSRELEGRVAGRRLPVRIVRNDTYRAIKSCDLILTKSGTVTLEAAILQTPMVAFYKVSKVSKRIGELLATTDFVTLPNLIAGREIIPEFARKEPTARVLADSALKLLHSPVLLAEQRSEFAKIREQLGSGGVSDKVARMVLDTGYGNRRD